MAHRAVLTARQRATFFDLPTDEASLLQHYTLDAEDIEHIRTRRRSENQLGFALQLCAFRYPGRLLKAGEVISEPVSRFVAAQLGLKSDDLLPYAAREKTRREHLDALRKIYGYKMFSGKRAKKMRSWLDRNAEAGQSSQALVRGFVEECRRQQIILPGSSVIERHCADALVAAERRTEARIAARLDANLDKLLTEDVDGRVSRFVWLRRFEVGKNSADMNRQLDRLEFLQRIALSPAVLDDIPAHRVAQLRRQGEIYFTDGLRDITTDPRLAILATCIVEWLAAIADTVVETHDRIVGSIWREAKKICDARIAEAQSEIAATLAGFETLDATLLLAKGDDAAVAGAVEVSCGWGVLENLVATAGALGKTVKADALAYVEKGYHRFKLYASRMLTALDIVCASVTEPLLAAADVIRDKQDIPSRSAPFLKPQSKWRGHLRKPTGTVFGSSRYCSICAKPSGPEMSGFPIPAATAI